MRYPNIHAVPTFCVKCLYGDCSILLGFSTLKVDYTTILSMEFDVTYSLRDFAGMSNISSM